jgi:predicted anti-sigma-YlaC factor YlaD
MRPVTCDRARARISLQLDGELSRFEVALLERHLHGCAACASFAENAHETTLRLRAAPLEPAPQIWMPRRAAATRLAARVAAVTAAAAAAAIVAVSYVSINRPAQQASGGFGLWPTGLAVHPQGDGNLGVRHVAFETPAPGSERALLSA